MVFAPYISTASGEVVPVKINRMQNADAQKTVNLPRWQSDWTSSYISQSTCPKYAVHTADGELVALGMYEILDRALAVRIVYMEAQPESNPTLDGGTPKYTGIGRLMIALGIKLSIDNGFAGDVILEAKTTALAKHYEKDFGAILLPTFQSSAPRYLIADDAAKQIFLTYLSE